MKVKQEIRKLGMWILHDALDEGHSLVVRDLLIVES